MIRQLKEQSIIHENMKTVQFHPEACAGPLDTGYLFDEFMKMMEENNHA